MKTHVDTAQHEDDIFPSTSKPSRMARLVARNLADCRFGTLEISLPSGEKIVKTGPHRGPHAVVAVHRWRVLVRALMEGDIGLAASYIDGDWTTSDLSAALSYGLANEASLAPAVEGLPFVNQLNRLRHKMRRNSHRGSRRNIAAHYDLGNVFYAKWLDAGMHYSSAIYESSHDSLEKAQARKLTKIVELLNLAGGEKVLEIGSGWGAVAEHLVSEKRCDVTGLTLSQEQADYARERLEKTQGLAKSEIQLRDYRDVNEKYDRLVSIEMFEAVGIEYWSTYFKKLASAIKDEGCAVLQVITISEDKFDAYLARPDFIQRYIFPGGMLPTKTALRNLASEHGLQIVDQCCFGESYKKTLEAWRHRFHKSWDQIEPLGFDERFKRMWTYYFQYCEAGFDSGVTDVGLYKLKKLKPT